MTKRRTGLSFKDALDLVPDDMPDGAAFAMAHEMAGLEYGDGFDELFEEAPVSPRKKPTPNASPKPIKCPQCRKRFWKVWDAKAHAKAVH